VLDPNKALNHVTQRLWPSELMAPGGTGGSICAFRTFSLHRPNPEVKVRWWRSNDWLPRGDGGRRQTEAERERRAKVINAEGEFQAAQRLADAARIIEQHPVALQLRYLQTLAQVARENNSTTLFPLPIDLLSAFLHGH
jgi:hypothetical protein